MEEAQPLVKRILVLNPAHDQGRALRQQLQAGRSARLRARALVEQSEKAAHLRDFAAAIDAVESAVRLDPSDTSLSTRLDELRAAKYRADSAARLVASACENLNQNNLSAASRFLSDALTAEPGNAEAQRLLRDIQAKIAQRDSERRLRDGLGKAKGLLALQSFDEAIELLETLSGEAPGSEEVRASLALARKNRDEFNRQRVIQSEIDAAKNDIKSYQFEAAIARLEPLAAESSGQNDVAGLLAYARGEVEALKRLAQIKAAGAEAWRLLKAGDFDRALTRAEAALVAFPDNPILLKLRQTIVTERAEHQRTTFIQQALQESSESVRNGLLEHACSTLEKALLRYPGEAALGDALLRTRQKIAQQQEQARAAAPRKGTSTGSGSP